MSYRPKATRVAGIIIIVIGVLMLILGTVLLFRDFIHVDENSFIGQCLAALGKWYFTWIFLGGGIFFIVFIGIGLCCYDSSDVSTHREPRKTPDHYTKAKITGSKKMYVKGHTFGCTHCGWSCSSTSSSQPKYKCKNCGSYNCRHFYATDITVCNDCGSFDTKLVCPECGHDIKVNDLL